MFPSFIGILDIQSWWEVPCIAYFCSLFRTAFNLLDFDIEELEEALLTDGTEETASSLLTELIVRLLNGCLGNNDISAFNYQMYLRRLFRQKCQDTGRYNPFNTDIDFQFLPLRTKVEILYALCDFRLDASDVFDLFKNLEAESLRVEPLGCDDNDSAYWYFYGTRLYREDIVKEPRGRAKKKKNKKRGWFYGDDWLDDDDTQRVWQVVCFTEEDWNHLTDKFSRATSKVEKELYRSLSQNFLPEIPRLFQEKERLQRKRLLELAPRRTSSRVLQKIKQKEEEVKESTQSKAPETIVAEESKQSSDLARENRARRRNLLRSQSTSSESENSESEKEKMPQKVVKRSKQQEKRSKNSSATHKGEPPPGPPVKTGRKTNNSLASATGQILIPENDEPVNSTRKKLKTSQIFSQTEEDIQTDMYKVLEQLLSHDDAWPFMDPVEEEYAPNYYAVIRRPMDLRKMEERLDGGFYTDFSMFKADFKLIVNNCRLYNGQDNEYTAMVDNLQAAFDRLTEKYINRYSSSDEEIAVEFQLPTPSRKHKRKASESPTRHKRKKTKSLSETVEPQTSSTSDPPIQVSKENESTKTEEKKSKDSHKSKLNKSKSKDRKKKKGHHRHGKHSKHRKDSHKTGDSDTFKSKHNKKQKHEKNKDGKKSKKKKNKHRDLEPEKSEVLKKSESRESLESSNRSRSASPLPSIHTPSPSPTELDTPRPEPAVEEYKDKFDMIKERRRAAAKDAWESLFEYKNKSPEKQKQNVPVPEKDKHQKLRETIEKLKAKNEKYKDASLFTKMFSAGHCGVHQKANKSNALKETFVKDKPEENTSNENNEEIKESNTVKGKSSSKLKPKKSTAKNESASEALEQAVKDITKWLDDPPKRSAPSSPSENPTPTPTSEDQDTIRLDDEISQGEKPLLARKETSRKRPSSREPKFVKRREIQRTIERLQPGKSKGNLLTNITNKNNEKTEDAAPLGPLAKARDISKSEESSPKLSLGSVLPTVEFTLGSDHNFSDDSKPEKAEEEKKVIDEDEVKVEEKPEEKVTTNNAGSEITVQEDKKETKVEEDPALSTKPSQEKATPNLSAWFKAFGAPKTPSATVTTTTTKKKVEEAENEEKNADVTGVAETKLSSPKHPPKYDSPTDPDTPNPDGGDSPLPSVSNTPKQRRTSTGSSVSERSSFSQDLDSPRHQMSHNSPLLRSPASPRNEDFQKITYPIINGTVRAGFYQDTTSMKSSPEKSCSPREGPQSPYSPYSSHVYATNNVMGSSTPNYFVDHNKSPLPTYSQNPPPFYDSTKIAVANKTNRNNDDYTSMAPETFSQNTFHSGPYSPAHSPYPAAPAVQSSQPSPLPSIPNAQILPATQTGLALSDAKSLFPVKKRTYNEPELPGNGIAEHKDLKLNQKVEYSRQTPSLHSMSTSSVDDIALALSEKSEITKLNSMREKIHEHNATEINESQTFERREQVNEGKKETPNVNPNKLLGIANNDNIDMVNMGYMNPDQEKRFNMESRAHEIDFLHRDMTKSNLQHQQKGYEIDAIAINLGMNSQHLQKFASKTSMSLGGIPPAHSHERHSDMNMNINMNQANMNHAHQNQYNTIATGQSLGSFSLNDIELANKKLYSCSTTTPTTALDYGNWKMTNQIRKQEILPSDFSNTYNATHTDKMKVDAGPSTSTALNYKNIQHYSSFGNTPRPSLRAHDLQQSLPAELRIPNPRGLIKNDQMSASSSMADSEMMAKNLDVKAKSQKSDKLMQNHPLVSSVYKTPYSSHSSIPLDSLRNIPNIPQMLERYTNDERYLSGFASSTSSLYHEKTFQMAQMLNKSIHSDHGSSTSSSIYSQPSSAPNKDTSIYKNANMVAAQMDAKTATKNRRKRATETKPTPTTSTQVYHNPSCGSDVLSSVKSSMMSGSAFNFGTSSNMGLTGSIYGDNSGFSIEDFRNSTNQLMAANYMAAAVAHQQQQQQQRSGTESAADKLVKPAHQNSSSSFPYLSPGQVRAGYGFADPASPLYQQYLQRRQEELLRQTGAQIMSLYPPAYPPGLGARQPYDSLNRPSWL